MTDRHKTDRSSFALAGLAVMIASCGWFDGKALPPVDADAEADSPDDGPAEAEADPDFPIDGDGPEDPGADPDTAEDVSPESVFTPLGLPPGGDFMAVALGPDGTETVYAIAAYQRVYRSDDGALTWSECGATEPDVFEVAATPDPPGDVYIGGQYGVLVSRDGCASWETTGLDLDAYALTILGDGDVLAGTEQGLRRFDGASWSALVSTLEGYEVWGISGSADGSVLLAGSWGNGMALSMDGGSSWTPSTSGLSSLDVHHVAAAPGDPRRLYAYTESGLERSTDGGATWSRVHTDRGGALAVSPLDAEFVIIYQWNHLLESLDGGDTFGWEDRRSENMSLAQVEDIAFDPSREDRIYAATVRGVFRLDDVSRWSWTEMDAGLDAWSVWDIALAPETGALYLASPSGVLRSTDGGAGWSIEIGGFPTSEYVANAYTVSVATDATDPDTLVVGSQYVYLSTDGGSTFDPVFHAQDEDGWWVEAVAVSGSRLYAGTDARFLFSPDAGGSWFPNLIGGEEREAFDLMIFEEDPALVVVATGTGLFSTVDDGESFDAISDGLTSLHVHTVARLPGGRIFAGTPDGVFSAAAPGGTFERRSPAECWADSLLAAGDAVFVACDEGVFRSGDEGLTWAELPGMAGMWPTSLGIDGNGNLLVGTWGFGLHAAPLP